MLYAIVCGLVVFAIGNLFMAAKTAAIIGFVTGVAIFFGFFRRD